MKSRQQKEQEYKQAKDLLQKSNALVFVDFTDISNSDLEDLRTRIREQGGRFKVMKKRVLNVLFRDENIDMDLLQFEGPVGAVFANVNIEDATSPVYNFFSDLPAPEGEKKGFYTQKMLGGYNLELGEEVSREKVLYMGQLPPREVVLGQLLGQIAAPITGFMQVLKAKVEAGE